MNSSVPCGWLQAIQEQMKLHGNEPVKFEDIKVSSVCLLPTIYYHCPAHWATQDEIFDMVKPADPHRITLQDLITRWGGLGAVMFCSLSSLVFY